VPPAAARGARGPGAGSVNVALQSSAEQLLEPLRDADQGVEVDAGVHSFAFEQVDQILGRDVARRTRRVGAAAEPADRGVEDGRACFESGPGVRETGVARVV
jgi:hypothetical protein